MNNFFNFVFLVLICSISAHFVSKRDANSVLDVPESYLRQKRNVFGKSIKSIKKKWDTVCKFNSVEKWDEFKDELEETSLPEKEVDRLESCTFKGGLGECKKIGKCTIPVDFRIV